MDEIKQVKLGPVKHALLFLVSDVLELFVDISLRVVNYAQIAKGEVISLRNITNLGWRIPNSLHFDFVREFFNQFILYVFILKHFFI